MFIPHNTEEIKHAYKSKDDLKRENQLILLKKTDGEKWHYLSVKKLSALFEGIASKHDGDFYCINFIHLEQIVDLKSIIMYVKIMKTVM